MNKEKLKTIMEKQINPLDLAKEKYLAYKRHILDVLHTVEQCITDENFGEIFSLTELSDSGDGYGDVNNYIDFGYDNPLDIVEAVEFMLYFKAISDQIISPYDNYQDGFHYTDYYSKR